MGRINLSFAKQLGETVITRLLIMLLAFGFGILVTRILGPEGRGSLAIALALAGTLIQFGNLGLETAGTYRVSKTPDSLSTLMGNSIAVALGMGCLLALLAGLLGVQMGLAVGLVAALAVSVPFGLLQMFLPGLLLGLNDVRGYNLALLVNRLSGFLLILVLILVQFVTPTLIVWTTVGGGLLATVFSLRRLLARTGSKLKCSIPILREDIHYGVYVYLINTMAFVVLRVDLFLVDWLMDSAATGHYSIAQSIADMVYVVPSVLGAILFPRMVKEKDQRKDLAVSYSLIVFAMVFAMFLVGLPTMAWLIPFVYGQQFAPAASPTLILILAMAFYAAANMVSGYVFAHGRNLACVLIWLGALLANVLGNLILIPIAGLEGAAYSTLLVYMGVLLANVLVARRLT